MKKVPFVTLRYVYFSFETIDLSENKEYWYLNALEIQKTLSYVGCYPVAREMV